jgi:hypothetical protein
MLTRRVVEPAPVTPFAPGPCTVAERDEGARSQPPAENGARPEALDGFAARADAIARDLLRLADLAREAAGGLGALPPGPTQALLVPPRLLHLVIEGARMGRRSSVLANGSRVDLADCLFVLLVRLVRAHVRAADSWWTTAELGIERSSWRISRLRCAFRGHAPEGAPFIEADGRERYRLGSIVVVDRIDLAALGAHPDAAVRKLAAEWTT